MRVLVTGAGPAGSSAAYFLQKSGHQVTLIDPHGPHEKTCGGGVPIKAINSFPEFFDDFPAAKHLHEKITFSFEGEDFCTVPMLGGMGIFSRYDLDKHIFDKALAAGVTYKKFSFKDCSRDNGVWSVETDGELLEVDYIIGADGATSRVRNRLSSKLPRDNYFKAADYLVEQEGLPLHVGFQKDLNGYLWVFPRENNCSIGIVDFDDDTVKRKRILKDYLSRFKVDEKNVVKRRTALIPSLTKKGVKNIEVCGDGWALVGDAAAMAEPVTGEGIYYALRSARLLSECLENEWDYNSRWKKEFNQIVSEAAVSRFAYKLINKPMMKFLLGRSSLMRNLTGEYLAAFKGGFYNRVRFSACLPFIAIQALISKKFTFE